MLAMYIGYAMMIGAALFVIGWLFVIAINNRIIQYRSSNGTTIFRLFGFGFVKVTKYTQDYVIANEFSKTSNRTLFLSLPNWIHHLKAKIK